MAFKFNPVTGELDLTGSGSGSSTPALGTATNPFPVYWYVAMANGAIARCYIDYTSVGLPIVTELYTAPTNPSMLMEDGFYLLLETGDKLLIE